MKKYQDEDGIENGERMKRGEKKKIRIGEEFRYVKKRRRRRRGDAAESHEGISGR